MFPCHPPTNPNQAALAEALHEALRCPHPCVVYIYCSVIQGGPASEGNMIDMRCNMHSCAMFVQHHRRPSHTACLRYTS